MRSSLLLAILSSTSVLACSVEEPVLEDSSDKNLLVRVNRGAEQSVSFHAVDHGAILVTQTGGKGASPLELSNDPLTAFQQAAPGHPIPEVLDAFARAPQIGARAASIEALVPAEPVILELEAPVLRSAFPPSSFICWARNRYKCFFNVVNLEDIAGSGIPSSQTVNLAWAVDRDYLPIQVSVYAPNTPAHGYWYYEVWDGHWRTWSLTGYFATLVYSNRLINNGNTIRPNARFHYSSAGAQ